MENKSGRPNRMPKRISHSALDPFYNPAIKRLYRILSIPHWFPPEGIIAVGHMAAILGAIGFGYSVSTWWGGLVAALCVMANHLADCLDGTHARATGQCRNGGELLDHFVDPLSFSYWICGIAVSIDRLDLGLVGVILLYATSVLTNIKAKMIGQFTLASFGPTEFKTLLALDGILLALLHGPAWQFVAPVRFAYWFLVIMIGIGVVQLVVNLVFAVQEVNTKGPPPDITEWESGENRSPGAR
jgi:phosphatidylglycerophosphate synthase